MSSYVLVTNSIDRHGQAQRTPLQRLVVPVALAEADGLVAGTRVWWVERDGSRLYLRAKTTIESSLPYAATTKAVATRVWPLTKGDTDRISWSATKNSEVEIGSALRALVGHKSRNIELSKISEEIDALLDRTCTRACSRALTFEAAAAYVKRLLHNTRLDRPTFSVPDKSLRSAAEYMRSYFCRSELVSYLGYDPYQIAAAVLIEMPQLLFEGLCSFSSVQAIDASFIEFDADNVAKADLKRLDQHTWATMNVGKLFDRTARHQQIVRALAQYLRSIGRIPLYNTYVDLCFETPHQLVIIEVKSTCAEDFDHQVREAVGQLMEYRFRYRPGSPAVATNLVAVIERSGSSVQHEFARRFLAELGIQLVLWPSTYSTLENISLQCVEGDDHYSCSIGIRTPATSATAIRSST